MKTIAVPGDIKLAHGGVVSFREFVRDTLLCDPRFGRTMADVLSAVRIAALVDSCADVLALEDADHDRLLAVCCEPTGGYNPVVARQIVGFMLAIEGAQ